MSLVRRYTPRGNEPLVILYNDKGTDTVVTLTGIEPGALRGGRGVDGGDGREDGERGTFGNTLVVGVGVGELTDGVGGRSTTQQKSTTPLRADRTIGTRNINQRTIK